MKEQLEEQRNNFLLDVRAAVKRNQVVVMILYNSEKDDYLIMRNGLFSDFDDVLESFCEMPFLGRITPEDAFKGWDAYVDDVALAEIYGFELEDGMVQITILDSYIPASEVFGIQEACCSEELSNRLHYDGYNGDTVELDSISLACAMRWFREAKGVYINIRMTFWEREYTFFPKLHFVADICDINADKWIDNDIWEETYEKCAEAAINFYYDYKDKKI